MRAHWLVVGALVASCSRCKASPTGDAAPAPGVAVDPIGHPCSLLRRSDVERILGPGDLRMQEQPGGAGDAVCTWSPTGTSGSVELRIHVPSRTAEFSRLRERKAIPGIGDEAYLEQNTARGHVDVLKGGQTFYVQVDHSNLAAVSPARTHAEATGLARDVASRM